MAEESHVVKTLLTTSILSLHDFLLILQNYTAITKERNAHIATNPVWAFTSVSKRKKKKAGSAYLLCFCF